MSSFTYFLGMYSRPVLTFFIFLFFIFAIILIFGLLTPSQLISHIGSYGFLISLAVICLFGVGSATATGDIWDAGDKIARSGESNQIFTSCRRQKIKEIVPAQGGNYAAVLSNGKHYGLYKSQIEHVKRITYSIKKAGKRQAKLSRFSMRDEYKDLSRSMNTNIGYNSRRAIVYKYIYKKPEKFD